jgi:NodT family efflux transporter outer membrane factor (OMF) lipoprotein
MRRTTRRLLGPIALAALAACTSVGPDFAPPPAATAPAWGTLDPDSLVSREASDPAWWKVFGDPLLERLVAATLEGNPSLQSAAMRIVQAQAQLQITDASARPTVQGSAGLNFTLPDARDQVLGTMDGSTAAQILGQATWEVDLWGKFRRASEADQAALQSTIVGWHATAVSLASSVASTYLGMRTLEERLAVARANLALQAESLRIARVRFQFGAVSELDVRQAEAQYRQNESQVPGLVASVRQYRNALAVLVGIPPANYDARFGREPASAARVPGSLPLGVPADLLRRRPDVVQALWSAASQSARIGQAQAALYPSFSLTGAIGLQASDSGRSSLDSLFSWDSRTLSLGGGLLLPIFDRGRLIAQVKVQDAAFEQALLAYQTQVLKAQQEVEDALASISGAAATAKSLAAARDAAARSAELALIQYRSGATDYTTVTNANQSKLQAEDSLAQAEGNLLQGYVSAYRALGGGWSGNADTPPVPPDSAARMRSRAVDENSLIPPAAPARATAAAPGGRP